MPEYLLIAAYDIINQSSWKEQALYFHCVVTKEEKQPSDGSGLLNDWTWKTSLPLLFAFVAKCSGIGIWRWALL